MKNFTSSKRKACAKENLRVQILTAPAIIVAFEMKNVAETHAAAFCVLLLMSNIFLAMAHAYN